MQFSSSTNPPRRTRTHGVQHLEADARNGLPVRRARVQTDEQNAEFKNWAQIEIVTDDATVQWPAERERLLLGTDVLNQIAKHSSEEQKQTTFDPAPRVKGIEPSAKPLLDVRAVVYLVCTRRRAARQL